MWSHRVASCLDLLRHPWNLTGTEFHNGDTGMPTVRLTSRSIEALPRPGPGQTDVTYWDEGLPCFGVRVGRRTRSYVVAPRVRGKKGKITIGKTTNWPFAAARVRGQEIIRAAALGDHLAVAARTLRGSLTVKETMGRYIDEYAKPQKRTWQNDASLISSHINTAIGHISVADLTRADVRDMLRPIAERTSHQANRVLETFRKALNWAIAEEIVKLPANPAAGIGKVQKEERRTRVLREDEYPRLAAALASEGKLRSEVLLLLLTAARKSEVRELHLTEIDGDWWVLPAARSKNGVEHRVYLVPTARQIIAELTAGRSGYLFSADGGASPITRNAVAKHWPRVLQRAQIQDLRLHDLRRSAATGMASIGVPRLTISKILNHVDGSVTSIYERHGYDGEKRAALEAGEARLVTLMGLPTPLATAA